MHKPSEGLRRLGIVIGVLAAIGWIILVANVTQGFARMNDRGRILFWVGIPLSFGMANLAIRVIDWVVVGFKRSP